LKVKEWKSINEASGNHKKAGIATSIARKIVYKTNRNKKVHFTMSTGYTQPGLVTCTYNTGTQEAEAGGL
jgi:hypothetical protein